MRSERGFNDDQLPLVSVITVSKNSASYMSETIRSVSEQTYPRIEYLVIDGASHDGTVDIIRRYEDSIDYWCSEPDGNMYEAINKGISLAHGDVVVVLNSDDRFRDKDTIRVAIDTLLASSSDGVYGDLIIDYGGKIRYKRVFQVDFNQYLLSRKGTFVPHVTLFVRRTVICKLGGYDDTYKFAADYDFILRLLREFTLVHIPVPLAIFRRHTTSITSSGVIYPERKRVLIRHGILKHTVFRRVITYLWVWAKYYTLNIWAARKLLKI